MSLPDPLVVRTPGEAEQPQDAGHSLKPWSVQRNFEALAQRFPLGADSGNFQQVPQARVYHSVNQSINNATHTVLAFNSERWDLGTPSLNMHDTVTNNSRLTCRVPGLYAISANVRWATNTAGFRILRLLLNGADLAYDDRVPSTDVTIVQLYTEYRLVVGDYLEVGVYQSSGAALNVEVGAGYSPEFMTHWVSP